jgi:hypothetical protein
MPRTPDRSFPGGGATVFARPFHTRGFKEGKQADEQADEQGRKPDFKGY